jgi:formylglycine-generating enzyme required for sulfatase activity/class 3 adenylate cyclase
VSDAEHTRGQIYPIRGGKNGTPSPPEGLPRRLAAIVAADIAGYSRLMGHDEEGTHARIKRQRRELIEPTIAEHHGKLIKYTGDGFLAMFDSPVEAVRCAIVIQQSMVGRNAALPLEQRILYRIGIHLGDVIVEPEDIYGEGVNIAARLEGIARPGDLYISGGVYEQIKNKLVCAYQPLGDKQVKNITDPVTVYRVLPDPAALVAARKFSKLFATLTACALLLLGAAGGYYLFIANYPPVPPVAPNVRELAAPALQPTLPRPDAPKSAAAPADAPRNTPAPTDAPKIAAAPPEPPKTAPPPAPAEAPKIATAPTEAPKIAPAPTEAQKPATGPVTAALTSRMPDMVWLAGGTFAMGSNDDPTEKPVHRVTVKPFVISKFPVTVREWNECAAAKACSFEATGKDDAPVGNLSWNDAQDFIAWLSRVSQRQFRLPTEAEWEYAARAGTQTKYWWGDQMQSDMANCKGCGGAYDAAQPLRVGSFKANPFGLYDMGGSINQWVEDCWHKDYQGAPADGSAWIERNCPVRVMRSGSWRNDASYIRPASRDRYDTGVRYPTHGFRIAAPP